MPPLRQFGRFLDSLRIACILVGLLTGAVGSNAVAAVDGPVATVAGRVSPAPAKRSDVVRAYLGLPYAAPPIGERRWRPPAPVEPWRGVRAADRAGPPCFQGSFPGAADTRPASEDCLTLNIWTPARAASAKLPVMVWIHGGAYVAGSNIKHDGSHLARKGVVVVAINYRLGLMGFFTHPELTAESERRSSGDYALLDTIAALKWVQANIAEFGGDPARVTVFGQSAGSETVSILTVSPLAKGLFQRAIGESGGSLGWRQPRTLPASEQDGVAFAAKARAGSLAALRKMSATDLYKLEPPKFEPVVDGWVYPLAVHDAYAQGKAHDIPMIVGSNADEGQWSATLTANAFVAQTRATLGRRADDFLKRFPASTDDQARASSKAGLTAGTDYIETALATSRARTSAAPAHQYRFIHAPPKSVAHPEYFNTRQGAYHAAELVYVFAELDDDPRAWTAADRRLETLLSSYWVNFARSGDPNEPGLPHWPSVQAAPDRLMQFDRDAALVSRPSGESQAFFEDLYYGPQGVFRMGATGPANPIREGASSRTVIPAKN